MRVSTDKKQVLTEPILNKGLGFVAGLIFIYIVAKSFGFCLVKKLNQNKKLLLSAWRNVIAYTTLTKYSPAVVHKLKKRLIEMKNIEFKVGIVPKTSEIIEVYDSSGIKRPTKDSDRITKMYKNSNLIITAWLNNELIGISRSITDFCYACYLSDLAVKSEYQKEGIGRQLIKLTEKEIGKQTALILLSAPLAMEYYPKIGFDKVENGFIIRRTE